MGISRQQILLIVLFALAMAFKAFLVLLAWQNSAELTNARQWSQHSDDVVAKQRETNQAFKDADICGRVGVAIECDKERKRSFALQKIAELKEAVADSSLQSDNTEAIRYAVTARFTAQDEALKAIQTGAGGYTIPAEVSLNLTNATVNVERAFNSFEIQEYAYLRLRHRDMNIAETRFNNIVVFLVLFSIVTSSSFAYFGRSALIRAKRVNDKLRAKVTPNENTVILTKAEYGELLTILRGE